MTSFRSARSCSAVRTDTFSCQNFFRLRRPTTSLWLAGFLNSWFPCRVRKRKKNKTTGGRGGSAGEHVVKYERSERNRTFFGCLPSPNTRTKFGRRLQYESHLRLPRPDAGVGYRSWSREKLACWIGSWIQIWIRCWSNAYFGSQLSPA